MQVLFLDRIENGGCGAKSADAIGVIPTPVAIEKSTKSPSLIQRNEIHGTKSTNDKRFLIIHCNELSIAEDRVTSAGVNILIVAYRVSPITNFVLL